MQNGKCKMENRPDFETDYWLELMAAEEIIPPGRLSPLMQETRELIAIFTTIIQKARANP